MSFNMPLKGYWTLISINFIIITFLKDILGINKNLVKRFVFSTFSIIKKDNEFVIENVDSMKDIKKYKPKSNSISNSQILFEDYNYINARKVLIEMIDYGTLQLVSKDLYTNIISFSIL